MSNEQGVSSRPRVLLADDHTLVNEGLAKLLHDDFDLVGTVEDGRALIEAAQRLKPDVILLDISMPLMNGVEAARRLKQIMPQVRLIFLTMHSETGYVREAFRAGASGYVLKRAAAAELVSAIHDVMQGKTHLSEAIAMPVNRSRSGTKEPGETLTARQREVVQLVAEGHTAKEVAHMLVISVKTVEFHKTQIMQRLGVNSVAQLIKYALDSGIVGP
jgi:DNA-binding NarL/FixJ family response regulator